MESLPSELQNMVCSYLPHADLITLSHTCRSLAATARPWLFEQMTFHGDDEYSLEDIFRLDAHNPKHPIELNSLEDRIDEVLRLSITKFVKRFRYGPKLYVQGFWTNYRHWVEEWTNSEFDPEDVYNDDDDSDAFENDEEWGDVATRRYVEARRRRPEEEREAIAQAELYWHEKIADQKQVKDTNHAALVRLFRSMTSLNTLELKKWSCAGELVKHGIEGRIEYVCHIFETSSFNNDSEEVECQFSEADNLNLHLETLGNALHEAGVGLKHLFLPTVDGQSIAQGPAVQHLFSTLSSLSLHLENPSEMLTSFTGPLPAIGHLIRHSRHSLERLEFHDPSYIPARGEHLLEKLWGKDAEKSNSTLSFPRLRHFQVRTMIFFAPSLIDFLRAQPSLESVSFTDVYLHTPGYSWSHIAAALPPSCQHLGIFRCGGQLTPEVIPEPSPHPDVAYNQIPRFDPQRPVFPASCGWRISESFLKQEAEQQACKNLGLTRERLAAIIRALDNGEEDTTELPFDILSRGRVDPRMKVATLVKERRDGAILMDGAEYVRV